MISPTAASYARYEMSKPNHSCVLWKSPSFRGSHQTQGRESCPKQVAEIAATYDPDKVFAEHTGRVQCDILRLQPNGCPTVLLPINGERDANHLGGRTQIAGGVQCSAVADEVGNCSGRELLSRADCN